MLRIHKAELSTGIITTGLIIPNNNNSVVSIYQLSHIRKCSQTEIHNELPGLQAHIVNSFRRETRVNCVAVYIITVLLFALS